MCACGRDYSNWSKADNMEQPPLENVPELWVDPNYTFVVHTSADPATLYLSLLNYLVTSGMYLSYSDASRPFVRRWTNQGSLLAELRVYQSRLSQHDYFIELHRISGGTEVFLRIFRGMIEELRDLIVYLPCTSGGFSYTEYRHVVAFQPSSRL